MLGKLIKNEFKATSRNFIPMYLFLIVVAVFMKILIEVQSSASGTFANSRVVDVLMTISVTTFVIAIIAVILGTIVLIIKRFYDNMLKDEGYLSFTLPVSTGQHIVSKVLTSYVWVICSAVVIIGSILISFIGEGEGFKELGELIIEIIRGINAYGYWNYVIEFVLVIVIAVYANIMMGYTCLSVGQNFNKHRIVGAFITYIVIYMITEVVNAVFMFALLGVKYDEEISVMSGIFHPFMIYLLGVAIVEAVVFTLITYFMLNRKLNLE